MLWGAGLGCEITAVTITGGERERRSGGGQWVSVPKQDVIAGVQVALENGDMRIARRLKQVAGAGTGGCADERGAGVGEGPDWRGWLWGA
jgi:hypothetical protein